MAQNTFLGLIEQSIRNHWEMPAMTDYQGRTYLYKDMAREIDQLHHFFNKDVYKRQE